MSHFYVKNVPSASVILYRVVFEDILIDYHSPKEARLNNLVASALAKKELPLNKNNL